MSVDIDLCYMPATEIAERIRAGSLTAKRVIENSLMRIAAVNPKLNCFCSVYSGEALLIAEELDREAKAGRFRGPLHGVPFAIKDLTPTKGKRTTLGSYAYADWVPDHDAPIVEALKAAGGVMLGKTTTSEFASSGFTESPLLGITRNPWNPDRSAGGSSGGSAVAVATGCVPIAEGSDMGGSVRVPAAFCGVVGMKPSFGRIPFTILPSEFDQLSHFGPLARTVADACLFLQVTQGPDERDVQSLTVPQNFLAPFDTDLTDLSIGLCLDFGRRAWHPEVEAAVRAAAGALSEAGARVENISLPWGLELDELWLKHWEVYLATFFGHTLKTHRAKMDPELVRYLDNGLATSAVEFKSLEIARTSAWRNHLAPILSRYHALLCPTMARPAVPLGGSDASYWKVDPDGTYHCLDVTAPFSLFSMCPALSIPCGWSSEDLPMGLQIVARRHDDRLALRIGATVEQRMPWAHRRPGV
ncbi:amidase [Phyllobacterium sophorae]|uniref:Indoleacetamide hydrolase n=1 Tax=Phyllobacterium sophorae TaxID=1520277 RepID=A0A2P7AMY8_9HYPH|nr:amidase [Phyllobacterium sophorae]PSH55564.1 amidase [Phyllobacterium sophorae]